MRFPSQKALFAIAVVIVTVAAVFALPVAADEPPKPSFAGVVEKASRQLTTCTDVCGLRNLLFGSSESMTVAVRQTGPAEEVKPVAPKLVLQGQHTGDLEVVSEKDISFVEAADKTTQDHFTIDLSGITEADEYTGALLFDTTSKAAQVSIPIIVKIREGPFWPLLILLGSVFLGVADHPVAEPAQQRRVSPQGEGPAQADRRPAGIRTPGPTAALEADVGRPGQGPDPG